MTTPSKCRCYFAGWCERNYNTDCIRVIRSDRGNFQQLNKDCKYYQPNKHGGKKKWTPPIIDPSTLTEEQREAIKAYLNHSHISFEGWFHILNTIFGESIYKEE